MQARARTVVIRDAMNHHFEAAPFRRAFPWILLTSFVFFLNYLSRSMFGPMLPALESAFSISHAASTRLLFYLAAGYSVSLFCSGFSASKVRPRIMVGGTLLVSGASLLALARCESLISLTLLFLVFGLVAGQQFNAGMSIVRSLVPPRDWNRAISVHEVGPNTCLLLGPLVVEFGVGWWGWQGLTDHFGWLLIAAGAIFLAIGKGGETPAAPVSLTALRKALHEPLLWLFAWVMSLAVAGQFAPYSVMMLHMLDDRHLPPETASFLLSASRVSTPFAVLCGGWLAGRIGTRKTLTLAYGAYAVCMFLLAQPVFAVFTIALFVQPFMTAMVFPSLFTILAKNFPTEQPMFLAIGMPVASLFGLGCMPPLLGLWGDYAGFGAGFVMMGVIVLISMPLIRRMGAAG